MYLLTILLIIISCSRDEDLLKPAILDKPSAMNVFCQRTPNDPLKKVAYRYTNTNDNLITETFYYNGDTQDKTTFEYNSDNQLIFEICETYLRKTEKTYNYNGLNQLINIKYKFTDYGVNGQIVGVSENDAPREYENNQLVKEWEYWGGFKTYEYSNGKLVTMVDYTKYGVKNHITTYKYSGDLLIEEKEETNAGGLIYLKTYTYDSQNKLIQIRDGINVIEENDYIDNKLMEKRTYYYGIDPGFDVCYGNYIYRYKY